MKNTERQTGVVMIEAILLLISIVVFASGAWLQMSASGSTIRSEIQRNQPYPISYHVLQEFLIAHPYPTNEDMMNIHSALDDVLKEELIAKVTGKASSYKDALSQEEDDLAEIKRAPVQGDPGNTRYYMALLLLGGAVLSCFIFRGGIPGAQS